MKSDKPPPSKPKWVQEVRAVLEKHKLDKEPYTVKVCGVDVLVFPGVFSPKYFPDTHWFAEQVLNYTANKSFLEIGCGAGALVLLSALNGATVTTTDINEEAVKNTKANLEAHGVTGNVYLGSLFDPISPDNTFDVIFWNHPFHKSETDDTDLLIQSCEDYQYQNLRRYIRDAGKFLKSNGRLLLGSCDLADIQELEEIASEFNYELQALARKTYPLDESGDVLEEYILYELVPKRNI